MKKLFALLLILILLLSACASGELSGSYDDGAYNADLLDGDPAGYGEDAWTRSPSGVTESGVNAGETVTDEAARGRDEAESDGSYGLIGVSEPAALVASPAIEVMTDSTVSIIPDRRLSDDAGDFGGDAPYLGGGAAPVSQTHSAILAGQVTGGEWSDHDNWDFWLNLLSDNGQFGRWVRHWQLNPVNRTIVKVTDESGNPIRGAEVSASAFKAVTDHNGIAYLFTGLADRNNQQQSSPAIGTITITAGGITETIMNPADYNEVTLAGASSPAKTLDLMFVVDTTGSMGDELEFLKVELEDVISRVSRDNGNMNIRLSVNFYRDHGDEYLVRPFPFTTDIQSQIINLRAQSADGGGDIPEAVDEALQNAIHEHDWDDDSIKLMFIVLDAPPHHNSTTIPAMPRLMTEAAEKGIRAVPVVSSGGCKETEFLMRSLAIVTGGSYTFTTAHSGIGYGHVEPTIGDYEVEKLNDILVRIINEYLN
jgi:hypothetical protein